MEEYLVVDGYNVIYAWPELDRLKETSLEHARQRLVDMMVNHAALSGRRVVVVFDAHQVRQALERSEVVDGVEVIYTAEGETADSLIERLVRELSARGRVYVVTFDWAEQRMILGGGAYRITPRELLEQVRRLEKESRRHYRQGKPADAYLENRLAGKTRSILEKWRRGKID